MLNRKSKEIVMSREDLIHLRQSLATAIIQIETFRTLMSNADSVGSINVFFDNYTEGLKEVHRLLPPID